jgi:hypothetical protein
MGRCGVGRGTLPGHAGSVSELSPVGFRLVTGLVTWLSARKERRMIARIWRGAVRADDAAAYASYIQETGIEGYKKTPGGD